jgi:hypothetical protein
VVFPRQQQSFLARAALLDVDGGEDAAAVSVRSLPRDRFGAEDALVRVCRGPSKHVEDAIMVRGVHDDRDLRRHAHVEHAQQVETREQAAGDAPAMLPS